MTTKHPAKLKVKADPLTDFTNEFVHLTAIRRTEPTDLHVKEELCRVVAKEVFQSCLAGQLGEPAISLAFDCRQQFFDSV